MSVPHWRIALVLATPGGTWGGMETHVRDLAQGLTSRGHEVCVLGHPDFSQRFAAPVRFCPMPMHLGRRNPLLKFRLRRALEKLHPDICHAHGNKAAQLIQGYSTSVRIGTVHGQKSSLSPFLSMDGVIAINHDQFQRLAHSNKTLIYNGITPPAKNAPLPSAFSRPLVVTAGRLEPVKGYEALIRAWARLTLPGHLVIAGDGSLRQTLERLIVALGLTESVSLIGYSDAVAAWLTQADACVISSQREGFPYLLVEALQCGCPVLSTPVGGASDFLPPDFLADDGSEAALANLLSRHLEDPANLKQAQSECMRQAREELTLEAMTASVCDFYQRCLGGRSLSTGATPD